MHLTATQALNNTYGEIIAAGYLTFDGGGAKNNTAATLYRHHSFDGKWQVEDGTRATYTMPSIAEVTGTVGGVIEGGQGVSIGGRSFSNVDVTAGTVGISTPMSQRARHWSSRVAAIPTSPIGPYRRRCRRFVGDENGFGWQCWTHGQFPVRVDGNKEELICRVSTKTIVDELVKLIALLRLAARCHCDVHCQL